MIASLSTTSCLFGRCFLKALPSRLSVIHGRTRGFSSEVIASDTKVTTEHSSTSFASLFENSKFARILDPVGMKVEGEILAVVKDKLYIDFGCKFHAVVSRPEKDGSHFIEGTKVVVLVKDLEMSMHPLGSSQDLSLLEAEAELCGLVD